MTGGLKHVGSLSFNYLAGITAADWWQLLSDNRFAINPIYWHRAAFISVMSLVNSHYRRKEEHLYGRKVAQTQLVGPPLFVLGHWRSGTSHLHNLLALDVDQFAYANTYQVVSPHTFLCTEEVNSRRFARLLPETRPMDNMALTFDAPQEDEFAVCLNCFRSLYLGISFPRREDHYDRYLTFRDVPRKEIEQWKAALLWFLQKLTFKYGRTIMLKSPPHTARIRLILELFPDARFVHIHRDPYAVFQSFQHYFDTAVWFTYLQQPNRRQVDERILRRYTALYDAYFEDRELIPTGRHHELRFTDLEGDPIGQMRLLYEKLDLPGWERYEPTLREYLASIAGYQKNRFVPLAPDLREAVAREWRRSFDVWGYPI
jgi:hypothetical protein